MRIAPPDVGEGASLKDGYVPIKNRPPGQSDEPAAQIISPDALALVRFGLRAPDDPRIVNTVKVIDAMLKVGHAVRAGAGTATTTTATASMRTASRSTAPASAAAGRC